MGIFSRRGNEQTRSEISETSGGTIEMGPGSHDEHYADSVDDPTQRRAKPDKREASDGGEPAAKPDAVSREDFDTLKSQMERVISLATVDQGQPAAPKGEQMSMADVKRMLTEDPEELYRKAGADMGEFMATQKHRLGLNDDAEGAKYEARQQDRKFDRLERTIEGLVGKLEDQTRQIQQNQRNTEIAAQATTVQTYGDRFKGEAPNMSAVIGDPSMARQFVQLRQEMSSQGYTPTDGAVAKQMESNLIENGDTYLALLERMPHFASRLKKPPKKAGPSGNALRGESAAAHSLATAAPDEAFFANAAKVATEASASN